MKLLRNTIDPINRPLVEYIIVSNNYALMYMINDLRRYASDTPDKMYAHYNATILRKLPVLLDNFTCRQDLVDAFPELFI